MRRLTKLGIQWSLLNRLTLIAMVLCPALSRAEIPVTAFESANKLYEQGKFAEAASAYASLLQEQLGERLDLPASAITEAVIEEHLRPRNVPETPLAQLHELFQT